MTHQIDLAIQIVNYNTKQYLINCLKDVFKDLQNSTLNYHIDVLDNNSDDNLSDLKDKFPKNKISFYDSSKNGGFGAGHNILAGKTNAKYILILNPDLKFLEDQTIERLYKMISTNPKVKVVGPTLITREGKIQWWDHGELNKWFIGGGGWNIQQKTTSVAWVSGAVFLIDRSVFDQVGGFDEHYFLYQEEIDLCIYVRKLGFKILYEPSIKVLHYGSVVAKKERFLKKSIDYYIDKHYKNKFYRRLFKFLNWIASKVNPT